mgnify:CR=1 FL=1
MNATALTTSVMIYTALKAQIMEQFALQEDDETLIDTLEGATDLHEVIAALAREADRAEEFSEAIKLIMDQNKERKDRFERKADKLRSVILWAMQEANLPKVQAPDLTISLRKNPPSLATSIEPQDAPEIYRKEKTTYTFDKARIKMALEIGRAHV